MKRLTIICLIIASTVLCLQQTLVSAPAYDARFLNLTINYTLNADGSWVKEVSQRVRLNTYYAFNRALGETFIPYNPDFQKLEIIKSETIMADGKKVVTPQNAFNEVLPFSAHTFADFAGLREMVITHTGLERGAQVELQYRLYTKAGFIPVFSGQETLTRPFPVDRYTLTVAIPASKELHARLFGQKAFMACSQNDSQKTYRIDIENLPPSQREPLGHPQAEPLIVFSTALDWKEALPVHDDPSVLPSALITRIKKIRSQKMQRLDLLSALQGIAADEVQNCPLHIEDTGWLPRPNERVASRNTATRLEKALLLKAILKEAGIDAQLLVAFGDAFAPQVPTALQAKAFWLKIPDAEKPLYLDPWQAQNGFFPFAIHGLDAWNSSLSELEALPKAESSMNQIAITGTLTMGADGVLGSLNVLSQGRFHQYSEASLSSQKYFEGLLRQFFPVEKATPSKLQFLSPAGIQADLSLSGAWLESQDKGKSPKTSPAYFTFPVFHIPMLNEDMVRLESRITPMLMDAPFELSIKLEIQPQKELQQVYRALDIKEENELGSFIRTVKQDKNGGLQISLECTIKRSLLGPEDYPMLRQLLLSHFTPGPWLVFRRE